MRSTFRVLFFLKRDKQKANGNTPLFCRITVDGKEVRFSMKTDVNPKCWNAKMGKACGRTNEAIDVNTLIDNTKSAIYKVYRELQERENNVTAEKVKNTFLGIDIKHQNLLEMFEKHNADIKKLIGISISQSTYDKYRITRNHLADFIKEWYDLSEISLKDINHKFICDFEIFMLTSRRCAANTTAKYIQLFKHIIIIAMKNGWIYKNPFTDYNIQIKSVDRGYLTQEEIETIMNQKFSTKRLEQVRDIFVFSCFTGVVDKKQRKEKEGNRLIVRNECPLLALSAE